MEKQIQIGEKKFKVRELLAVEIDDINWDNKAEAIKKEVVLSTGLTEEEYKSLTVKERLVIIKTINEINGFDESFQQPAK